MGKLVQMLVSAASFDASGTLVPEGHIGTFDEDKLENENGVAAPHLHPVGEFVPAVVETSAIAPTGPNPTAPQQIPPNAVQGPGGEYLIPGKRLVGEVTNPSDARIDDRGLRDADHEAEVSAKLEDIMGSAAGSGTPTEDLSNPVEGTVSDVTADLGTKTDDQLNAILDAEQNREGGARVGVVTAVQKELDSRKAAK